MSLSNDLLLRTARGEKTARTPVWLMRQAGRILPQYRKLRRQAGSFRTLVETPELAAEATLQPVNTLGVDAAIIFSDILVVPQALGYSYELVPEKGPRFSKTINKPEDIDRITVTDITDKTAYTPDAIRLAVQALNGRVPLIGFAGAPWTIMAYMVEGSGSKTFSKAKRFLYSHPEASRRLLQKITDATIAYLSAQIEAGADMVQVFDSWAGLLGPQSYRHFMLPGLQKICEQIDSVPVVVFAKGAHESLSALGKLPCQVIGLDWTMAPQQARHAVGAGMTLQGNADPCLLYADTQTIQKETEAMLRAFGKGRHIANLGHGVYPDTPLEGVQCFIDTVKNFEH